MAVNVIESLVLSVEPGFKLTKASGLESRVRGALSG